MKIGIDARALNGQLGGDETYMRNTVRALAAVDADNDYTLFLQQPLPRSGIAGTEHMRRVAIRAYGPLVSAAMSLPLSIARRRIDVLHVQYMAPLLCPGRIVVSVHDIAYERHPEFFTAESVAAMRAYIPRTIRRSTAVLTPSEYSRRDIVDFYGLAPEKIVVAPCAADPIFRSIRDQAALARILTRYHTGERFILCVGNVQPRKNLKTLIDAYVRVRRADATQHKLVMVGRKAWLYDDTFAAARASGYQDDLIFTGYVPDDDLVALYNAADLFVYPSLFEGFGLPPLEAMACGTPVVTSNTSALPETVGNAALTIDPLDVEALAQAMATVLNEEAVHAALSERGIKRASVFSWEATARIILDVYRESVQSPWLKNVVPHAAGSGE